MSSGPAVSVVVPFFQSERHIRACIESLLQQVDVDGSVEIILVDNGSSDQSAAIASEYPAVTVLREPTPGAYAARNTGIRNASAPVIAFTDADCVVDSDWVRAIQAGLRPPETAVVIGHCRYPASASRPLRWFEAYENAKAEYVVRHGKRGQWFAYANNMAVRASVFTRLGLFREWARAADSELVHRMASESTGLGMAYCEAMRVTHLEFVRARDRTRRLALYTRTNSKIETFEELTLKDRFAIAARLVRRSGRR